MRTATACPACTEGACRACAGTAARPGSCACAAVAHPRPTPNEAGMLALLGGLSEPLTARDLGGLVARSGRAAAATLRTLEQLGWAQRVADGGGRPLWRITRLGVTVLALLPETAPPRRSTTEWRQATRPVTHAELTPAMLEAGVHTANATHLPQTVWPSHWYGLEHFYGPEYLITHAAAHGNTDPPSDAAKGADPLLTVLPATWWAGRTES